MIEGSGSGRPKTCGSYGLGSGILDTRYRYCTYPAHNFAGAPALVEAFRCSLREVHYVALHEETLVAQARHPVHQVPHPVPLLLQQNRVTAGSTREMENISIL
jgi:hypothetical protein